MFVLGLALHLAYGWQLPLELELVDALPHYWLAPSVQWDLKALLLLVQQQNVLQLLVHMPELPSSAFVVV